MLLAFRSPSPLAGLTELPSRLLIAKWGNNESTRGDFTVNERTAKFLPAMQKLLGFDSIALDFEHNTVPGTEAYKADKEPRNIAATGRPVVVPGEGIYVERLQWTPSGEKSVREGLHPDLSPTIKTDDAGSVVFMHSAALCRQGAVPDLQVFSAALTPNALASFSAALSSTQPTHPTMDFKKLLLLLLGLDANAADSDIETAAKQFADSRADTAKTAESLKTYSADLKKAHDAITALAARLDQQERDAITAGAIRDGKLIPNSATDLSLTQFRALLADLPAGVVPLEQRTPEGLKSHAVSLVGGNPTEVDAVSRQMGVTPEALKKYQDKRN